jgi:hypothetical protein
MVLRRSRSIRLSVQTLEERATPATFVYKGISRTLTVTAAEGDQLTLSQIAGKPTGYIALTEATAGNVFRSDNPNGHIVRNLIVQFSAVNTGALTVDSSAHLGGFLTVFGAQQTQSLTSDGTYGNGLYYHGTGTANDTVALSKDTRVGGKVDLELGDGTNTAFLRGGFIGGDLIVNSLGGTDTINMLSGADLRVHGSATFNLGNGTNVLRATGANLLDVGKTCTYQGGIGKDSIFLRSVDANTFDSSLRTGQDAVFNLSTNPADASANDVEINQITTGGNLSINGSGGTDTAQFSGPVTVGGDFLAKMFEGTNLLNPNLNGIPDSNQIGKNFRYSGGAGEDEVWLDGTSIGRAVDVSLGNVQSSPPDPAGQFFKAGTFAPNTVYGAFGVKSGVNGNNTIVLHRDYIGNGLTITTGSGNDFVGIDDTQISGHTLIDLGPGNDVFSCERSATDAGGALDGTTEFGGQTEIKGGLGGDEFRLGNTDPSSHIQFGDKVTITGDDGNDTLLALGSDVQFFVSGNLSTCETGPTLP